MCVTCVCSKFPTCLLGFNSDTQHLNINTFDRTSKRTKPQRISYLCHSMRALFCGNSNQNSQIELWIYVKHLISPEIIQILWDMFFFKWINDLEQLEWIRRNVKPNQNKNFSQTDMGVYNKSFTLLSPFPSVFHTPQWEDKNYYLRINFKTASWKVSLQDNNLYIEAGRSDLNTISKPWDIY